jgi:hypothetical protein
MPPRDAPPSVGLAVTASAPVAADLNQSPPRRYSRISDCRGERR